MTTQTETDKLRLLFGFGATDMPSHYKAEQKTLEEYMDVVIRSQLTKRGLVDVADLSLSDTSGISVAVEMRRHELVCHRIMHDEQYKTAKHPRLSRDIMNAAKARHMALGKLGLTHADTEDEFDGFPDPDDS